MARLNALLRAAAPEPGDLVVIPELWPTGYARRASLEAATSAHGGRWSSFVAGIARECGVFIAGSAPHTEDDRLTNRLVVYGPSGDSLGFYDKMHLFPPMREDELFSAGGKVEAIPLPGSGFVLGPAICYDLRFPELFRLLALRGATLFVLPSEFPDPKEDLWHVFLASRAAENQAYVVACNRTGESGAFTFFGSSAVYDPLGRCLGRLGREEGYLKVPLDASEVVRARASLEVLSRVRLSIGV
ncbi:MAG: carbon-nitrogen family hydrolase [Candidatus Eisenbacteria bacterium]|nr:carbon-nitrogen family hydrolase [Candidatus Eisenbacteria bacterium]